MQKPVIKDIETSVGLARAVIDTVRAPRGMLVLGHGAGGAIDATDLLAVRSAAIDAGLMVVRLEQPYRVAGRRAPAPAKQLDAAWCEVIRVVRRRRGALPLIVGGRSSGARVACRTASQLGATGVLTLAFPLQPPGKPAKSRLTELEMVEVPMLMIGGAKDPFGLPPPASNRTMHILPGRAHGLLGSPGPIAQSVIDWIGLVSN